MISVEVAGVRIDEPMTALTDILIAGVCWTLWYRLKGFPKGDVVHTFYRLFFFMIGVATLLGGIFGHAFQYAVGVGWKLPGWITSMISVMLAERSAIMHTRPIMPKKIGNFFSVFNILELLTLITLTCITVDFFWVEFHAFYGFLFVVGAFEIYNYRKTHSKASRIILLSVFVSAMAATAQIAKITISPQFDNLALAHVLMCFSAIVLYTGVKNIPVVVSRKSKFWFL